MSDPLFSISEKKRILEPYQTVMVKFFVKIINAFVTEIPII